MYQKYALNVRAKKVLIQNQDNVMPVGGKVALLSMREGGQRTHVVNAWGLAF
jgi:hypothetical protein